MQDETRRAELDSFHTVLTDISHGATTNDVREFMIDAYVRGYEIATAAHVPFEGSTAVFTRRRYRDKWNRTVVRRIAKKHNHSIKIRACVRPKGVRSGQWYAEDRVAFLRKKCRTQSLWNLHLAGALTGGTLNRLRTPRLTSIASLSHPHPLKQRRLSSILRDKASNCKPLTYDASHGSGKCTYAACLSCHALIV